MRVLVTGATGMIGRAVTEALLARGDHVVALTRGAERGRLILDERAELPAWGDPIDTPLSASGRRRLLRLGYTSSRRAVACVVTQRRRLGEDAAVRPARHRLDGALAELRQPRAAEEERRAALIVPWT